MNYPITQEIGQVCLMISIIAASSIFGGNLFDMIVNESNLVKGFPESLHHIRKFYAYKNPGDFFKVLTPVFLLTSVAALVIF